MELLFELILNRLAESFTPLQCLTMLALSVVLFIYFNHTKPWRKNSRFWNDE